MSGTQGPLRRSTAAGRLLVCAVLCLAGCATGLDPGRSSAVGKGVPAPSSLRPCCAFGDRLGVELAGIPLPIRMDNVVSLEDIGPHAYDGGLVIVEGGFRSGRVHLANDGMAYTCRAGFVDTAHVRDYADWTFYFYTRLLGMLEHGGRIELPDEGGVRVVYVAAADPGWLDRVGRSAYALRLAGWLAFELSIWHETATWFGWAAMKGFPELASAFSPEDLSSNALGVHVATEILRDGKTVTADEFETGFDSVFPEWMARLRIVSHETTHLAVAAVDRASAGEHGWWDSRERLPAKGLVVRRNVSLGPRIEPWRVPARLQTPAFSAALAAECGTTPPEPFVLEHTAEWKGLPLPSVARLDLRPTDEIAARIPMPTPGSRWLSQDDLRPVVEAIRDELRAEEGSSADRP